MPPKAKPSTGSEPGSSNQSSPSCSPRLGRNLHYRDTKADLELHLWAASHNLLKAIRAHARRTTTPAPRPRWPPDHPASPSSRHPGHIPSATANIPVTPPPGRAMTQSRDSLMR
jgi:hypothetical protein